MFKRILLIFLGLLTTFLLISVYFLYGIHLEQRFDVSKYRSNAIWIGHSYSEDFKDVQEIENLVATLSAHNIRYVYVHTGPFEEMTGIVHQERYKAAERFLSISRSLAPQIQWLAWLGQIRSKLPLEDASIRKNVLISAQKLIYDVGFDGIHYDIEPVPDGDQAFLQLLRETRQTFGPQKIISIASDEWQSKSLSRLLAFLLKKNIVSYWGNRYFAEVSGIADQIVVMTYDSWISEPWLYQWWVEQQLIYTSRALKDGDSTLFIGIPAYKEATSSFNPEAENLETGLLGIIRGLKNIRTKTDIFEGVAIYPYWTMEEEDWKVYRSLWSGRFGLQTD